MSRVGLALMLLFLSLATLVQANDPDPLVWMIIYGAPCVLTLVAFINVRIVEWSSWWVACAGVFVGVLAIYIRQVTFPIDQLLHWEVLNTEEGRELAGVGLVLLWILLLSQSNGGCISSAVLLLFGAGLLVTWVLYRLCIQPNIDLPQHCSTV